MKFLSRFMRKPKGSDEALEAAAPVNPPTTIGGVVEVKPSTAHTKSDVVSDEILLELGDFLQRIPTHLLKPGPHDSKIPLRFSVYTLSKHISQGLTDIPLSEIYKLAPQVFAGEIRDTDNAPIRLPWRKLAQLIQESNEAKLNGGQADPAIEALSERIRSQKTVGGITKKSPSADDSKAPLGPTPVLPGRGFSRDAWFSKPTIDRPAELQKGPRKPHGLSPTAAIPPAAPFKMPEADAAKMESTPNDSPTNITDAPLKMPEASEAVPVSSEIATALRPGMKRPNFDDLNTAALPADMQRKVAVIKGEYERFIAELESARMNVAVARDRHADEVAKLRRQLDEVQNNLAVEETATIMTRDLLKKATAERDAAREQMEARSAEITELKRQIQEISDTTRLAELTAERDALLQQKAFLTAQVNEMSKRGNVAKSDSGSSPALGSQRQADELQRRIAAMEANQRETALELSREKEARAKAEKLLQAAEKLQEQSANYMESAKAEMRQELEASYRQRDHEHRRTVKELQDQITSLGDQLRKATTELETARLTTATGTPTGATNEEAASAAALTAQTFARYEEDIETYRNRLKILIAERDQARAASSGSSAEEVTHLRNQIASLTQRADAERTALEERAASLMQSLQEAQQSMRNKRDEFGPRLADAENRVSTLESQLAAAQTALRESQEEMTRQLREQSSSLEQQLAMLIRERDALQSDLRDALARLQAEKASRDDLINTLDREHTSIVRANEEVQRKLAELEKSHSEALATIERLRMTPEAAQLHAASLKEVEHLRAQLAEATNARIEAERVARSRNDALHESETTLNKLAAEQQGLLATLTEKEAATHRLRNELASTTARIAEQDTALAEAHARLREIQTELEQLRGAQQTSVAASEDRIQSLLEENRQLREALDAAQHSAANPPVKHAIKLIEPEILPPTEPANVRIPFARPAPVTPPKVSTL